jgi:phage-related baseplate assembly protein
VKSLARSKANEWVGGIFISVIDPEFVDFNIEADIKLDGLITQSATLAAVETNLRDFYSAKEENFGRAISRSEIIAVIEGTKGVRRIEPQLDGEILAEPVVDVDIAPYKLPRLLGVMLNIV